MLQTLRRLDDVVVLPEIRIGEEIGLFYFRPTDVGIVERYNELAGKLDKITEPLEHININADGTADGDTVDTQTLKEAERRLSEAVDYMLGGNASEAFFGKVHPFSPVNGAFYCEQVIEVVGRFIAAQFDRETRKINKRENRVNRYTQGYKGGKHRPRA